MKMRGRVRRLLAMLLAFVLVFGTVAPSVLAAEEGLEQIELEQEETQEETLDETLEELPEGLEEAVEAAEAQPAVDLDAEYPYGAFAFGDFQVNLTEGDADGFETIMIPVYRVGGARGRAEVTILYSPAISQITEEEYILDYAASAKDDLLIEV